MDMESDSTLFRVLLDSIVQDFIRRKNRVSDNSNCDLFLCFMYGREIKINFGCLGWGIQKQEVKIIKNDHDDPIKILYPEV